MGLFQKIYAPGPWPLFRPLVGPWGPGLGGPGPSEAEGARALGASALFGLCFSVSFHPILMILSLKNS